MSAIDKVFVERGGDIWILTLQRPEVRNAVDATCARQLHTAFEAFEQEPTAKVAVLTGAGGNFCAGADLKAVERGNSLRVAPEGPGPLGPTRMELSKPVIAAVEGYAVAGGLELALWADLRVMAEDAKFGVFCRRFGVPLIDGGTVRLPRLIGLSRALDLILTGREVGSQEAFNIGLANRVVPAGEALSAALELAAQLARLPQDCLRGDRIAAREGAFLGFEEAMALEYQQGLHSLASPELRKSLRAFVAGAGRHGKSLDED